MAQHFKFFNSTTDDRRKYQAQDFADYFGSVLSTGLLHTDKIPGMKVSVEAGTLNTVVTPGKAIMSGHMYENTTPLTLAHSIPEPTLDRLDRIVLRLNLNNAVRDIKLQVLSGESSINPIAPELIRTQFIHDISLAQIRIRANTVQLLPTDLVDERLDQSLCGLVYSLISIPTDQLQNYILAKMDVINAESIAFSQQLTQMIINYQSEWGTWFNDIKTKLPNEASLVSIQDAAKKFMATNVEDALLELFLFADDGKNGIANAVDAKGVPASPADTFSQLATKIGQINTGRKWAGGTINGSSSPLPFSDNTGILRDNYYIEVMGLDFEPSLIVILNSHMSGTQNNSTILYDEPILKGQTEVRIGCISHGAVATPPILYKLTGNAFVNDSSFRIPVRGNANESSNRPHNWLAFQ